MIQTETMLNIADNSGAKKYFVSKFLAARKRDTQELEILLKLPLKMLSREVRLRREMFTML